jgi:prolyl-tRNA editing enzyme YbaK/EbsC (Cys-tRNA(Pro) deacylase)
MEKAFHDIKALLEKRGADFRVLVHEPVHTSEEAARARRAPQKSGIKALIFFCDGSPFLVLVRGDHKADTKKLRKVTQTKDIRLATAEEVVDVCNCEIGSVHPLGPLMNISKTIMDRTILNNDRVNFSAGLPTHTINMPLKAFVGIAEPVITDIAAT